MAALAVALAFGTGACGGDSPTAVVPPPPRPPPPFQPRAIEVPLGRSGQSATLMTTEAGGYTLDGQAFASGGTQTVAVNGTEITYTLALREGEWRASYESEIEVELGETGYPVKLVLNDSDGTFSLFDEVVESGYRYRGFEFSLDGQQWTATWVEMTLVIPLGESGESLTLTAPDPFSWRDPDGAIVEPGSTVGAGGDTYLLASDAEREFVATLVVAMQTVPLGQSGIEIPLWQVPEGTWITADGRTVNDGSFVSKYDGRPESADIDTDASYRLALSDGQWTAAFDSGSFSLGRSGETLWLQRREDGSFERRDGTPVESGMTVMSSVGASYILVFAGEHWTALFDRGPVRLGRSAETLWLRQREDGTWERQDGTPVASGTTVTGDDGARYTLSFADRDASAAFIHGSIPLEPLPGTHVSNHDHFALNAYGVQLDATGLRTLDLAPAEIEVLSPRSLGTVTTLKVGEDEFEALLGATEDLLSDPQERTVLTRFGAFWRSDGGTLGDELADFSQIGLFAYSPMPETPELPSSGFASYFGGAVARSGGTWYSGSARLDFRFLPGQVSLELSEFSMESADRRTEAFIEFSRFGIASPSGFPDGARVRVDGLEVGLEDVLVEYQFVGTRDSGFPAGLIGYFRVPEWVGVFGTNLNIAF